METVFPKVETLPNFNFPPFGILAGKRVLVYSSIFVFSRSHKTFEILYNDETYNSRNFLAWKGAFIQSRFLVE